ncbi:MAG: hypothetical protein GF355_06550, partial [Candidatus Eisenbacteria bacterium]|nr:hypothetical protein [Candidatus Eisenbacteria bacterium]
MSTAREDQDGVAAGAAGQGSGGLAQRAAAILDHELRAVEGLRPLLEDPALA